MYEFKSGFDAEVIRLISQGDEEGWENKLLTLEAEMLQAQLDTVESAELLRVKLAQIKDADGNSLLHMAVKAKSQALLLGLLRFDLKVNCSNNKKQTPLILAQTKNLTDLVTVLQIYSTMQETLKGFSMQRAANIIQATIKSIAVASGLDKVMFIGPTGAGKSTLLNYLNGTSYEIYKKLTSLRARPRSGSLLEVAKTSDTFKSQTLYPQILRKTNQPYAYCDLAGLFDTRTKEEKICAAISAMLLSKSPGKIKCLMVVLDFPSFIASKGDGFKSTAQALAALINRNPELMNSVHFIITKIPPAQQTTLSPEIFVRKYVSPLFESLEEPLDEDGISLRIMLGAMRARVRSIIIPDISDQGSARIEIEQKISSVVPQMASDFNFNNFDGAQREFNECLANIARGFLARFDKIEQEFPDAIDQLQAARDAIDAQITLYTQQIDALKIERELQNKLDKITTCWVKVADMRRVEGQTDKAEMRALLNQSARLLEEIKAIPSKNLPKKIGWLSIILGTTAEERTTLLTKEISARRWCLPWEKSGNGQSAGPSVLIENVILKAEEAIQTLRGQDTELKSKQKNFRDSIVNLKLDLKILDNIYSIAKDLIEILGYTDADLIEFKGEYERYMQDFAAPRAAFVMR